MSTFDRKTFKGKIAIADDKILLDAHSEHAILKAESNLKDFVEASWEVLPTKIIETDIRMASLNAVEGSFKISLYPPDSNKLNILFKNKDFNLEGACIIGQNSELSCKAAASTFLGRLMSGKVVVEASKETRGERRSSS